MLYLTLEEAIDIHDEMIEQTGGLKGYHKASLGYLASALEHIQEDAYYPTFPSKLAHLIFACIKFHPFADGNKRSSIYIGMHFLSINGFSIENFARNLEDVVVQVAEDKLNKEQLQIFLKSLITPAPRH